MKKALFTAMALLMVVPAMAVDYSTDFEADAAGTLPAGWYLATPWGDWAPGPITAGVEAAPGGGQALKVVWGTDWASYGASSGETGYTMDVTGIDTANGELTVSYDMYRENWGVWMMFGDQSGLAPAGIHMNDDPGKPNHGVVGTTDYAQTQYLMTDMPEAAWIHFEATYNSGTGDWMTTVSYTSGSGGGTFSGTYATPAEIAGEYWFGGWAFQSTMDAGSGVYDNALYIDNFSMTVTPEPTSLLLISLAGLFIRRR